MQPGEDPAAVADDRELALADRLDQRVVGGAVKPAVTQRDAAEAGGRLLQVGDRGIGLAGVRRRGRIDRVGLGLDRAALARVQVGREALRHEPAHACFPGGGQQRVGSLGAQAVGGGEGLVQAAAERDVGQRRGLMHDRVGPGLQHGPAHGTRVEQVEPDRLGAQRGQQRRAVRRVVSADHLVPGFNQLRYQMAPECAARPGHEDSHRVFLSLVHAPAREDTPRAGNVTGPSSRHIGRSWRVFTDDP